METLKHIVKSYELWVAKNPDTISDVETATKYVSYLVAGRITDSSVGTELIYSLSNLLVLYNDRIIAKKRIKSQEELSQRDGLPSELIVSAESHSFCYRLKVMLTTLEYCEVFIEISAQRLFGTKGKWLFIALAQCLKAMSRFFILKHSTERIITSPAVPAINRKTISKNVDKVIAQNNMYDEQNFTIKLKRSGRIMRKVEGAPPLQYRSFKIEEEVFAQQQRQHPKVLLKAEYLYIAKPLIHLAAMGVFGEKSWKQYIVSLAVDVASIKMYHNNRYLMTKEQQRVLSHRTLNLCMYMMRSPLYEGFTKSHVERGCDVIGKLPILKLIASPLREYIHHWQEIIGTRVILREKVNGIFGAFKDSKLTFTANKHITKL